VERTRPKLDVITLNFVGLLAGKMHTDYVVTRYGLELHWTSSGCWPVRCIRIMLWRAMDSNCTLLMSG